MPTENPTANEINNQAANNEVSNNDTANDNSGNVRVTNITHEMQDAYLDYAMSVIVSRALPDARDGLKPVHRRILYAMYHDLGLTSDKPHKKSARIVGEVLGKYHPHGDTAVYDAMARMAQDFSLRYPLVDGQGNFGSIDGDNPAAMRYTEARLDAISDLILTDLDKETVDWHDNFDNSLVEPDILPASLPNLLINGASGIAVGMSTNIPPHNLREVIDALVYVIDRFDKVDEITVEELVQFIQGPDFPTGGILYRFREEKANEEVDAIAQGYSLGRSRLILQAKAHFEEMSRNRSRIVITELPYQTNKTTLIERIASLVRDGKIEGITDLRDESDRTGMRVVIELTRNVEPKAILANLFKYTPLQQTFGMQMLALVDGQPHTLGLRRLLRIFIEHRQVIIRRRSEFDLARAKERAHILEGLLRALDILDEVIATIRRSQRVETARTNLIKEFRFSEIQAQAILDMPLRRLAALERKRLQEQYDDLKKRIAYLEDLLAHPEKMLAVIKDELLEIKEQYGDARRTQIVDRTKGTLTTTDLMPDKAVWFSMNRKGMMRRRDVVALSTGTLRQIGRNSEVALIETNTQDYLYFFSSKGQAIRFSVNEAPDGKSKSFSDLTEYGRSTEITTAFSLPRTVNESQSGYLFLVTEQGNVKRVTMADFIGSAGLDPAVMNVPDKDKLAWAFYTEGGQDVILVSSAGKSICFNEDDVRSSGLPAGGVGGMKLKKGETIVYAAPLAQDHEQAQELLTMTSEGYAKRTSLVEYSKQGRNGGGIATHKLTTKTGPLVSALVLDIDTSDEANPASNLLVALTTKGQAQILPVAEIPIAGRSVQGKELISAAALGNAVSMVCQVMPVSIARAIVES